MIASHNTFTYLTPTKWWMKLINFAAKCQSKNIHKLYEAGARFFDIRIKNLLNNQYDYGHTIHTYKYRLFEDIESIINRYPKIGLRIINEDSKHKQLFIAFCEHLIDLYPNNIRECIEGRKTWRIIARGNYPGMIDVENYSRTKLSWLPFRWPWLENKRYNKITQYMIDDPNVLYWCDFI